MTQFILVTLRNNKTNEEIMFSMTNTEQLKQATGFYIGSAPKVSIKTMLKKYISTDKPLSELEKLHAFCWSACFLKQSKLFQETSKLSVGWTFHDNVESLVKFQQEYHQGMKNAGAELLFNLEAAQ